MAHPGHPLAKRPLLGALLLAAAAQLEAVDIFHANTADAANLTTAWTGGVVPGSGDIAVWDSTVTAANTTALGAELSWLGIRISNPGGLVTLGTAATNTLTLGASGIDMSAATNNLVIRSNLTVGAAQTWTVAGGLTLQVQTLNTNTRLSGSGDLNLVRSGTGTAIFAFLPGASGSTAFTDQFGFYNYTGNWTIGEGVLVRTLRNGRNAWGSGTITLAGGTVAQHQNFSGTWNNSIILQDGTTSTIDDANTTLERSLKLLSVVSGSGNLVIAETGSASHGITGGVIFANSNTLSGTVTVNSGAVLRVGGIGTANSTDTGAGTSGSLGTASVVINSGGFLNFTRSSTWSVSNLISGAGALHVGGSASATVTGSGTQVLTLAGANSSFTGAVVVGSGKLVVGNAAALGTTAGTTTVAAGGTLDLNGFDLGLEPLQASGSGVTGSPGALINDSATAAAAGGTVALLAAASVGGTGNLALSGVISGAFALTKTGSGTLTLSGANTFTGALAVQQGTLSVATLNSVSTAGVLGNSSSAVTLGSSGQTATLLYTGATASSSKPFAFASGGTGVIEVSDSGATLTLTNTLSGGGVLAKAGPGTLVVSGTNNYSGGTRINAGVLSFGSDTSLGSGTISLGSGATAGALTFTGGTANLNMALDLSGTTGGATLTHSNAIGNLNINGNITASGVGAKTLTLAGLNTNNAVGVISGVISDSSSGATSIQKSGSGAWTLANVANTYTGSNAFAGGTLGVASLGDAGTPDSLGNQAAGSRTIALNGATLRYLGSVSSSTDRPIDLRASSVIQNNSSTGTLTLTSSQFLTTLAASARTLTLSGSNTGANTFAGVIADSGTGANITTLQKSDAGTWVLAGASTATGGVIINRGVLRVTGSGVLPGLAGQTAESGNIWFTSSDTGAVLEFESSANLGAASQIRFRNTGGGAGNGGMLRYIGTTEVTLVKTIQCDTGVGIRFSSDSVGGRLVITSSFSGVASGRPLYLEGAGTGLNQLSTSIGTGVSSITKRGAGTWVLAGSNSYTGVTTVSAGTLLLGNLSALGTTAGNTAVSLGATLDLNGIALGAENFSVAGGSVVNSSSTDASHSGAFIMTAASSVGGSGNLTLSGGVSGSGFGLTKVGAGTLTLSASSSHGSTTVAAGMLKLGHISALGTTVAGTEVSSGGVLDLNGFSIGAEALSLSGTGLSSGGALINSSGTNASLSGAITLAAASSIGGSGNLTLSGGISGTSLALTKVGAGTLTLSAASSHGDTTVTAGTLALSGSGTLGAGTVTVTGGILDLGGVASAASIVLNGGSLAGAGAGNSAVSGTIAGTFASGTAGTEIVTVAAGTSFAGTLKGVGTLSGDVTLATNSTHAPGNSPGLQSVTGDLTYANQTTVQWELFANSEAGRGASFDGIDVGGDLTLGTAANGVTLSLVFGGTVDWADAFWAEDRSWLLYDVAGATSGFSNLQITSTFLDASGDLLTNVRSQAAFGLQQVGNDIRITYTAVPEPSTYGLALGALALAGAALRRRRKQAA